MCFETDKVQDSGFTLLTIPIRKSGGGKTSRGKQHCRVQAVPQEGARTGQKDYTIERSMIQDSDHGTMMVIV